MVEIKDIIKRIVNIVKSEFELMIFKYNLAMCQFYKKQMYTHSDICKRIVEKWEKQW